jgi:hypothetical protein
VDFCYEQYHKDYIRVDLMPQRGGLLRVDVFTRNLTSGDIAIAADTITEPTRGHKNEFYNASGSKFMMLPGGTARITYNGKTCTIRYASDRKAYLSGNLPIAPYYNGGEPLPDSEYIFFE